MGETAISWTHRPGTVGRTWNVTKGCSRVSEGCRHCYAEAQAARIVRMSKGRPSVYDDLVRVVNGEPRWTGEVVLVPELLAEPLRWRSASTVFVNSMSDLFHDKLTNEQIAAIFGVMAACPQHTFQVLTKRAKRMREWFEWVEKYADPLVPGVLQLIDEAAIDIVDDKAAMRIGEAECKWKWPLPNVWLGVSVEDQAAADARIPELLRTPAAVRFLSCEPLIGKLNLHDWISQAEADHGGPYADHTCSRCGCRREPGIDEDHECPPGFGPSLDWVIVGCESGIGARECEVEWVRSLRDQCAAAGVALFVKQLEADDNIVNAPPGYADPIVLSGGRRVVAAVAGHPGQHKRIAGRRVISLPFLDGVQHAEFPATKDPTP